MSEYIYYIITITLITMSTSGINPPPSFLTHPGDPPVPWVQWKRSFDNYLVASNNDSISAERRRAILLHCIGVEGQRLFYTLPEESGDGGDNYINTVNLLSKYFKPVENVIAARYRFRQRGQFSGESIDGYISALRELAVPCNFGTFQSEMIRDQLVEKTNSTRLRERLLLEADVKLPRAIEIAKQVEQAVREAHSLAGATSTTNATEATTREVQGQFTRKNSSHSSQEQTSTRPTSQSTSPTTNQRSYQAGGRNCYRCNASTHLANDPDCPARTVTCNNCGKRGHYSRVCRQPTTSTSQGRVRHVISEHDHTMPSTTRFTDNTINSDKDSMRNESVEVLGVTRAAFTKDIMCDIYVNEVPIQMLVDTGSDVTILQVDEYDKYFLREALIPCHLQIKSYTKNAIHVLGCFEARVTYKDRSSNVSIYVVQQGTSLIGKDVIQGIGLHVDGHTMSCLTVQGSTGNVTPTQNKPDESNVPESIVEEFKDLFTDELGLIKGYSHKVKLKPGSKPVQQPLRRIPFCGKRQSVS